MEKKTIGGFIAALRKANGMTQKDLADRLNVSDKTISRWERDDGDPDLAAIPVMAEIFGVTCDELLRGERKSQEERAEATEQSEPTAKGEKQRQRLLKSTFSKYQTYTYIAIGVSVVGMIVALICNLAFLQAILGFLLGAIFFAASIVCQAVFSNRALLSVEDAGLSETDLSDFKRNVYWLAEKSIGVTVCFVGFTLPLMLVDAFMGLGLDSLLLFGIPGMVLFLLVYAIICWNLNGSHIRKGVYSLGEKESEKYWHNHNLKRKCVVGGAIALACTLAFHAFGMEMIWSAANLSPGTTFEDYDSFVTYMEQDVPYDYSSTSHAEHSAVPIPADPPSDSVEDETWYDENGNEITEEEARRETLVDKNGDVVCEYIRRNDQVARVRYEAKDGTVLPITVITESDNRVGWARHEAVNMIYCVLYPIELVAAFLVYMKKRAK
ncbi:helix-turn-helix domain-containing protein [Agathobaculum sp. LCP25S3_E8]|uniref:helix-turn-helix domain-containing protein n=1 Tax=Agathobaculum sp. LCP25S3_E8 TaxID=3438735 RepID=UPI003F93720D